MASRSSPGLTSYLIDYLLPQTCYGCGQEGQWLCARCRDRLVFRRHCPLALDGIERVIAPFDYHDATVKELIHDFKYEGIFGALDALLQEWFKAFPQPPEQNGVIVPIPMHWRRKLARGYNQTEIIARRIGRAWHLAVASDLLGRTRYTRPQVKTFSRDERDQNLSGSFRTSTGSLKGRTVYLVDDVITTGATVRAASAALRPLRPSSIYVLALARD